VGARFFGTGKDTHNVVTVIPGNSLTQGLEIVSETIQHFDNGILIGQTNVMPHHRIAARNAGEIAETASGITENLAVFLHPGQGVHQGIGQQMGHMAGGRQHLIVFIPGHQGNRRPHPFPQMAHGRQVVWCGGRFRRENHTMIHIKFSIGSINTAFL